MAEVPARSFPFAATAASLSIVNFSVILRGWSFRETTGSAAAALRIRDGSSATGEMVVPIGLLANESTRDFLAPDGLDIRVGVFIERVSGTFEGVIWYTPVTRDGEIELTQGERALWGGTE